MSKSSPALAKASKGNNGSYAPIAIVGMAFRFPGDIHDESGMWDMLKNARNCITQVPEARWPVSELQHPDRTEPGRCVSFAAGILSGIDQFDAAFFGISPREAAWLDPQQRLLLEMAHESMEDAGIRATSLAGTRCGVYVGISSLDYGVRGTEDLASMSAYSMTGNTLSIAVNRLSYIYDLRGPSLAVDTACSSSLVALHYACQALHTGDVPMALAGGVSLLMHPYSFVGFSKASMLSACGHCRPFDAAGDGYVRSEGGALLLLKPLSKAVEDGNHIHAVIVGSGVNTDGKRKAGLTIPSSDAQAELMRNVLTQSGLDSEQVDFIEAHGTGTPVGDPVEISAIGQVYGQGRVRPIPISSVKANVGHLEPASGMAGLIKTVLALKKGILPPMLLDYTPNPHIDFSGNNVLCAASGMPLPKRAGHELTAGVNSFGFGGVNAHVLVRAQGITPKSSCRTTTSCTVIPPLLLSARSDGGLRDLAAAYAACIAEADAQTYYNIAYSAVAHRDRQEKRLAVLAESPSAIATDLRAFAEGLPCSHIHVDSVTTDSDAIAFVYTGNGSQWDGMGRILLEESPEFAAIMEDLDLKMRPLMGFSVVTLLRDADHGVLQDTTVSQPLLFAIQVGLTLLLRGLGVTPQAVMGHSVGEITAAWAAGALSLTQAIRVIHARSHAQGLTRGMGGMAVVGLSAAAAHDHIRDMHLDGDVEIAGINSAHNVTLSGDALCLTRLQEDLQAQNIFCRSLDLDYAFHSCKMDGIHDTLMQELEGLTPSEGTNAVFVSTVTGQVLKGTALDDEYWWRNVRQPVLFSHAVEELTRLGFRIFVEVGPHAILQRYIREGLSAAGCKGRVLSSLLRGDDGQSRITRLALRLHTLTNKTDLSAFFPHKGMQVSLPSYPWQREKYWYPRTSEYPSEKRRTHPLLGWSLDGVELAWENILDLDKDVWLTHHRVGDATVFPAAGYAELALAMAQNWLNEDSCVLDSLDIGIPMVFENGGAQTLRCSLNAADGTFRILSRPRLLSGDWVQHATGRVLSAAGRLPVPHMEPVNNCQDMDGPQLYALTSALGLDYGPTFQVVRCMAIASNRLDAVLKPVDSAQQGYFLHPAVLDACFHALVGLYAGSTEAPQTAFLPVKMGRIVFCKAGVVTKIRAHRRRWGRRSIVADFELLDAAGSLVACAAECHFRAMPVVRSIRGGVSEWSILPWLCPHPCASSVSAIPPLDEIINQLHSFADENAVQRGFWFQQALPLLEATTISFALRAFHGLAADNSSWYQLLSGPYAQWLSGLLQGEGLLVAQADKWCLAPLSEFPPAEELWQEALQKASASLPSLMPVGRVGIWLEDILRGRMVGTTLLDKVRHAPVTGDSRSVDPVYAEIDRAVHRVVAEVAQKVPSHMRLRVLEITDFHIGLTETLADYLPADRFEHVMTLSDSKALGLARTLYEQHAHVRTLSFDPLQWTFEGETSQLGHFDVVLVRHCLHRAVNLGDALNQLRSLLTDGGLLVLAERHPDWSADFLEGLNPAWWHPNVTGPDLAQSSLLSPESWQQILDGQNFGPCHLYTERAAEGLALGAYLLLATHAGQGFMAPVDPETSSWLFLVDAATRSVGGELCTLLEAHGQRAICSFSDDVCPLPIVDNVVFMRGADDAPHEAAHTLNSLLHCARECAERDTVAPRLWVVTRGGALSTHVPAEYLSQPAQCALWGLGRVIANEYANVHCTLVDIPQCPAKPDLAVPQLAARLKEELLHPDGIDEILLTTSARYALRVLGSCPPAPAVSPSNQPRCRLDFAVPGSLRNLIWYAEAEPALTQGEIEARVMGVGLNFRDVMLTMGLLPDDALENGFAGPSLGLEFSGVITRVGKGVTGLNVGDRVVGFAPACFASHVVTSARTVAPIPEDWCFASAATIPTVFFTAYYALKHLAQVQAGERVLIHGGAGGVGLAAIQVARHLGAEIFVTVGSEEKRDFLRLLGVKHIFDSRSLSFDHDIQRATGGQGVDVVLNSLAGEAMRRSLGLLRPFGRFLELGKRDFVENTSLGLRPLKENISYFAIDADQLLMARPQLAAKLFQEVMQLLREGVFTLLPHRVFPASQVVEAFRAMQQARHMGKIVVSLEDVPKVQGASMPAHGFARQAARNCQNSEGWTADGNSTWIVTGGLSGFGLATARHLAQRGVKHLVLVGRGSAQSPNTELIIAEFAALGVQADAKVCDMADRAAVHALVAYVRKNLPPLKGVVHAAAVFDDRILDKLEMHSLEAVLGPKLSGAWHLHEATLDVPLEYFVLYSSISTVLGNPGQGNYVAANAGLEGLAQKRTSMGLPATCLAWGPVGDVGYLARHDAVKKSLSLRLGREPLTAAEAMEQLDAVLAAGGTGIFAHVEWNSVMGMFPGGGPARFAHVFRHGDQGGRGDTAQDMQQLFSQKSTEEITTIVRQLITEEVAQVLALGVEQVPSDRSLQSLGMDSLMAVELAVSLEKRMGVRLPTMMLQDSPTVEQVTGRILTRLNGGDNGSENNAEMGHGDSKLREQEEQAIVAAELVRRHAEEPTEGGVAAMTVAVRDLGSRGERA